MSPMYGTQCVLHILYVVEEIINMTHGNFQFFGKNKQTIIAIMNNYLPLNIKKIFGLAIREPCHICAETFAIE